VVTLKFPPLASWVSDRPWESLKKGSGPFILDECSREKGRSYGSFMTAEGVEEMEDTSKTAKRISLASWAFGGEGGGDTGFFGRKAAGGRKKK